MNSLRPGVSAPPGVAPVGAKFVSPSFKAAALVAVAVVTVGIAVAFPAGAALLWVVYAGLSIRGGGKR